MQMDLETLCENLLEELNGIKFENLPILEQSHRSIGLCRNLLRTFKREILVNDFESVDEEIVFFKKIKQIPLVKLIYFSEIHSFEIQFPKADKGVQLKFVKKKINKLNRFFLYNLDFGQYVKSGQLTLIKPTIPENILMFTILLLQNSIFKTQIFVLQGICF